MWAKEMKAWEGIGGDEWQQVREMAEVENWLW